MKNPRYPKILFNISLMPREPPVFKCNKSFGRKQMNDPSVCRRIL